MLANDGIYAVHNNEKHTLDIKRISHKDKRFCYLTTKTGTVDYRVCFKIVSQFIFIIDQFKKKSDEIPQKIKDRVVEQW